MKKSLENRLENLTKRLNLPEKEIDRRATQLGWIRFEMFNYFLFTIEKEAEKEIPQEQYNTFVQVYCLVLKKARSLQPQEILHLMKKRDPDIEQRFLEVFGHQYEGEEDPS